MHAATATSKHECLLTWVLQVVADSGHQHGEFLCLCEVAALIQELHVPEQHVGYIAHVVEVVVRVGSMVSLGHLQTGLQGSETQSQAPTPSTLRTL